MRKKAAAKWESEESIFANILKVSDPWRVEGASSSPEAVEVMVSARMGALFPCPVCGRMCKAHDRVERRWRDPDIRGMEFYIVAMVPRCMCPEHGVRQTPVPWAREGASHTRWFEDMALMLMRATSVSGAARAMGVGRWVLDGILRRRVDEALGSLDLSRVRRVMLDETSSRRGHRYITVVADADTRRVIFATEGKGADALGRFAAWLSAHGGDPGAVELVSCDFSKAFLAGIGASLPNAEVVYDRFHLVKMGNDALDEVRSKSQSNGGRCKQVRYDLLRRGADLTDAQRERLFDVREDNRMLGLAYEMKESLAQIYEYPSEEPAREHALRWIEWVREEGEAPMRAVARTVARHLDRILNWYGHRMSNGFLEGLNGMIQTAKRMARGYPRPEGLVRMVYFRHGGLGI